MARSSIEAGCHLPQQRNGAPLFWAAASLLVTLEVGVQDVQLRACRRTVRDRRSRRSLATNSPRHVQLTVQTVNLVAHAARAALVYNSRLQSRQPSSTSTRSLRRIPPRSLCSAHSPTHHHDITRPTGAATPPLLIHLAQDLWRRQSLLSTTAAAPTCNRHCVEDALQPPCGVQAVLIVKQQRAA